MGRRHQRAQHADRRSGLADHRGDARRGRRGQGRSLAGDGARRRRPAAGGGVSPLGAPGEQDDRSALGLLLGGDPRGARGRHRREAGRPGAGQGRLGRLEGSDRVGQPDGRQPDRAGAQHRRRDHRRRQRRSLEEDHRRRARRDPAAEGGHQHDGRSAARLRLGGDARGARGRHRREAGRPGGRPGRRRHLEGSDRQRERHGLQPDGPGAQHRRGDHGGRARRSVAQDHRRRQRGDPRAEEHHQHDGRSAERLRLRGEPGGARGRHRREAGRAGAGAGRGRDLEGSDRQRELDGLEPDQPGAQHRGGDHGGRQGRSRRARSPSTSAARSPS